MEKSLKPTLRYLTKKGSWELLPLGSYLQDLWESGPISNTSIVQPEPTGMLEIFIGFTTNNGPLPETHCLLPGRMKTICGYSADGNPVTLSYWETSGT